MPQDKMYSPMFPLLAQFKTEGACSLELDDNIPRVSNHKVNILKYIAEHIEELDSHNNNAALIIDDSEIIPSMVEAIVNNTRTYPVIDALYKEREKECYQAMQMSKYKDAIFLTNKTHIKDLYAMKSLGVLTYYSDNQPERLMEIFTTGWKKLYKQIKNNPDYDVMDAFDDNTVANIAPPFLGEYDFDLVGALAYFSKRNDWLSEGEMKSLYRYTQVKNETDAISLKDFQSKISSQKETMNKVTGQLRNDISKELSYMDFSKIKYEDSAYDPEIVYMFYAIRNLLSDLGLSVRSITDYEANRKEIDDILRHMIMGHLIAQDPESNSIDGAELDYKDYFFLLVIKIIANEYKLSKKAYIDEVFKLTSQQCKKENEEINQVINEKNAVEEKLNTIIKTQDEKISGLSNDLKKAQADYNKLRKQLEEANVHILELEQEIDLIQKNDEYECEEECENQTVEDKKIDYKEKYADLEQTNLVVFGGRESWQNKIKSLFPNWTVLTKMDLNFDSDLLYTREIIINTSVLNHAIYYKIVNGLPEGKKAIIINHNNIDLCLQKIRCELNKRQGKNN